MLSVATSLIYRTRVSAIRWLVQGGDGDTVGAIVKRAGGDDRAIAEGRVFVGRSRARAASDRVAPGDEVVIAPPSRSIEATVLLVTPDLVAVAKPAGIPTIPDHAGSEHALIAAAARAIGAAASSLHATSRLDRDVSGVVVFARTKRAADALRRARDEHAYVRRYVAIAAKLPSADSGTWDEPIGRAKDPRHRQAFGKDAAPAESKYRVVARAHACVMLALAPITGRTHQLRVHASHAGAPLLGDRTYGGPKQITLPTGRVLPIARIALHAARVRIPDHEFDAPIPDDLRAIWESLGGEPSAWDTAVSCSIDAV
jgi:RluA family pseudouridine synthase